MQYKALITGPLSVNCYLCWCEKSQKGIVIDPGGDFDYIFAEITAIGFTPITVIATHGHFDHILAVNELKIAYNIPFLIHRNDNELLKKMRSSCKYFCKFDPGPPPSADGFLNNGESIIFGNQVLKVIHTPGHTGGGICLYSKKEKLLFSGDTIFADGAVGRTDLKEGNYNLLMASVKKLFSFPPETKILSGHGRESTIKQEKNNLSRLF